MSRQGRLAIDADQLRNLEAVTDLKRQLRELTVERDHIALELRDLKTYRAESGWLDEADATLLGEFVREAGRIAQSLSTADTNIGGNYCEFVRLLEAVRQIDWIEK